MTALRMTDEDVYELDPRGASDPANLVTRHESRCEMASILAGMTEDDIIRLDFNTLDRLRTRLREAGFGFSGRRDHHENVTRDRFGERVRSERRARALPFKSLATEDRSYLARGVSMKGFSIAAA